MDENTKESPTFEDHIKELNAQMETFRQLLADVGPSKTKDLVENAWALAANLPSLAWRSKKVYAMMSDEAETKFKEQLLNMFSPLDQANPRTIPAIILALSNKISESAQEDVRIGAVDLLSAIGVYKTCNGTRERIELIFGKADAIRLGLPTAGAIDVVTTFRTAVLAMTKLSEIAIKGYSTN